MTQRVVVIVYQRRPWKFACVALEKVVVSHAAGLCKKEILCAAERVGLCVAERHLSVWHKDRLCLAQTAIIIVGQRQSCYVLHKDRLRGTNGVCW